jgi:single-stranded DNA-binding protein
MLSILALGTLIRDPERRQSACGKSYATAMLRVPCDEATLISVAVFSATASESLLALCKGDACAVAGRAKLTSWTKDGEAKRGLSVIAEKVMSSYQHEKRQREAASHDG